MFRFLILVFLCYFISCSEGEPGQSNNSENNITESSSVQLIVLGTIQDAGSPQIGCYRDCCKDLWANPDPTRKVVSLGIVDRNTQKKFLFEASPDLASQLDHLKSFSKSETFVPDGIFLTHAHIGHYTGLIQLGFEAMNAQNVFVHVMPKFGTFLKTHGPWSQLVAKSNIDIKNLKKDSAIILSPFLSVTPFLVPHRDEYSETVGYKISGPNKKAMFIPDIDKWSKWDRDIIAELKKVDYAYVDATFYDGEELNNRDMAEIAHPAIAESMKLFESLSPDEKAKVHFIHFNHTNPVLDNNTKQYKLVLDKGYRIAQYGDVINL